MVLPLYLALTAAEISRLAPLPGFCAYMACHFSPYTEGLSNIPDALPPGSILILNDRIPYQDHSADLIAGQLATAVERLGCESVLLDFERPPEVETCAVVNTILQSLPCPIAVTESFGGEFSCPIFLPPAPLHMPLAEYLAPWQGREIWLEAALCQERITVTKSGVSFAPIFPTQQLDGGFHDDQLHCRYHTTVSHDSITFTLFDSPETLSKKLEFAHDLGVARAVGLLQELGTFLTGKQSSRPSIAQ